MAMTDYEIVREKIRESYRNGASLEDIFRKIILAIHKPRYDFIVEYLIEVSSAEVVAKMLMDGCYFTALRNVIPLLCGHGVDMNWVLNNLDKNIDVPEGVLMALLKKGADHDAILERMNDRMIQENVDGLLKEGVEVEKIVKKIKMLDVLKGGAFIATIKDNKGSIDSLARNVRLEDLLKWYQAFDEAGMGNGILIQKFNQANIVEPYCYSLVNKNREIIQTAIDDCSRPKMKRDCQHKLDCISSVYSFNKQNNI